MAETGAAGGRRRYFSEPSLPSGHENPDEQEDSSENGSSTSIDFSDIENYYSTILETENTEHAQKPTEVHDMYFIQFTVLERKTSPLYGKWMVFKHYDEIDESWEKIRTAVLRDELQGCSCAAVSTMRYNPSVSGPGTDTTSVICVYSEEHDMDVIGFKLIEMVQQDIRYKTDQDSIDYKYSFLGDGRVTIKTIYWNDGRPSFECEDKPCYGTSRGQEDKWHLNVVEAPKSLNFGEVYGRWVLYLEYKELTGLWYFLKKHIESETGNFGVTRMVCPAKRVRNSKSEKPEFHIYTNKENQKTVGMKMIKLLKRDIVYEHKPQQFEVQGRKKVLYWNDGDPDYETVRRKGITKNWRTGEEVL